MRIGFTGTRNGLTPEQDAALREYLSVAKADEAWHGACVGADEQFAVAVRALRPECYVVACPSDMPRLTSQRALDLADEIMDPLPPLDRNHAIVLKVDELVACPQGEVEEQRSGTWTTIRYARKLKIPIRLIYPDGHLVKEN